MKAIGTILYEVNVKEIAALPPLYSVIQHNTISGEYRLLKAKADYFPIRAKFKYYLFQAPPLPKLNDYSANAEGVRK